MKKQVSHRAPSALKLRTVTLFVVLSLIAAATIGAQEKSAAATKPLTAEAITSLGINLSDAQKQSLLANGLLTVDYSTEAQTTLCPNPVAGFAMMPSLKAVKPSIGIETLVVYPMPARLIGRGADRDLVLYNLMHRFRSMEGIQYWSASRKAMRIFFTSSKLIKAPDDHSALVDPVYAELETSHNLFLEQEDSSFGKNFYDVEVKALEGGSILLNMSNRNQIWYGIIPVLAPRALSLYLYVQPSADGKYLYFYGNASIKAAKAFGVEEKAKTSYTNRIIALFNWYAGEMEGVK